MAGMARAMESIAWTPLWRMRKNCMAKIKSCLAISFIFILRPIQTTINCTAASTQRPHWSNTMIRVCCAGTKHCYKTVVLVHKTTVRHCERTRTLAFRIYKTSPFSHYSQNSVNPCCCVSDKRTLVRIWLWRV